MVGGTNQSCARGNGRTIDDAIIRNSQTEAAISLEFKENDKKNDQEEKPISLILAGTRKGRRKTRGSRLHKTTPLASHFRDRLTEEPETTSLPLLAFYTLERSVMEIPIRIRQRHTFDQLDQRLENSR
ncbi:hypothetical protein ACQZV8_05475 [Magnetococcales bacterium HHB-1]